MKRILIGAIATIALAASTLAVAQVAASTASASTTDVPFDFRGAKLGMTLADFRAMPFPDPESRSLGAGLAKTVKLVCTGDQLGETYDPIYVSPIEASVGAIDCAWMLPPDAKRYQFTWTRAYVDVGEYTSIHVEYRFAPSASGELALRQIAISLSTKAFQETVAGLRTRFGAPAAEVQGKVQNGIGNSFDSTTVEWKNSVSSLVVIERAGTINEMGMLYTNIPLDTAFRAKVKSLQGPPKL